MDGAWSAWTEGPCSVTCGGGNLTRTRSCDAPAPSGTGAQCAGPDVEDGVACAQQDCPACPPMDGMLQLDTGRFVYLTDKATFSAAFDLCESYNLGLKLASISTLEDYQAMVKYTGEA